MVSGISDNQLSVDPAQLLAKINSGEQISALEIQQIAFALSANRGNVKPGELALDDDYSLLLVLGRTGAEEYRHLVEAYLDCEDPVTASLALEILCLSWGLAEEYLERLLGFALGVPWDNEQDLRESALRVIGAHLASAAKAKPSKTKKGEWKGAKRKLFELLVHTFLDKALDPWLRQTAYSAICLASALPAVEMPREDRLLNLESGSPDINWSLIPEAFRG